MIKEKNQIFKCNICGNMVEAVHTGKGELVCCGEPMQLINENIQEEVATEKHIPVVKKDGDILTITIGKTERPMDNNHYIEWVEVISGPTIHRRYLEPGTKPQTKFICRQNSYTVRAYCNIHKLWSTK
jgi:superoxide reductase